MPTGTIRTRWGRASLAVSIGAGLMLGGCAGAASGPPDIAQDRTTCSSCGMFVTELVFAAARRSADGTPFVYDDIGCLMTDVRRSGGDPGRVWVRDFRGNVWIDAGRATFVRSPLFRTPMGGATVALEDPSDAERLAAEHRGLVLPSFEALRQSLEGGEP